YVNSLLAWNGRLYVGGSFFSAGGQTVNAIAAWDGTNWSPLDAGVCGVFSGSPSTVHALTVLNNQLVIAGNFTCTSSNFAQGFGSVDALGVARWNGSQWSSVGTGLQATSGSPIR